MRRFCCQRCANKLSLTALFGATLPSVHYNQLRRATSTATTAAVPVATEPEFEGEGPIAGVAAVPHPTQFSANHSNREPKSVVSISILPNVGGMGLLTRSSASHSSSVDKQLEAYLQFFNHIRFRNKWAEPPFRREDVAPYLREAADIVVRIRQHLDVQNPSPKLRKLDGEAQTFLMSTDATEALTHNPRLFVAKVVDFTFRDASGYVEGLSRDIVTSHAAHILKYQFNPRTHALHQAAELAQKLASVTLGIESTTTRDAVTWTDGDALTRTNKFYVSEAEDSEWRAVITKLYDAIDAVNVLTNSAAKREKPSVRKVD